MCLLGVSHRFNSEDNDQPVKDIHSHHLVHTWKSCPARGMKKMSYQQPNIIPILT